MIVRKISASSKNNNEISDLLLFFAGWGMDEHPVMEFLPADRDCAICYDYSSLSFDKTILEPYNNIRIVAWSMGVWAASQVLADSGLPVSKSIVINGTLWPIDDEKGIATNIFCNTLAGLNERTLQSFRKRMCVTTEAFSYFMYHLPQRDIDNLREELCHIGRQATAICNCHDIIPMNDFEQSKMAFNWDKVIIGANDRVFLPANQQKAWQGKEITIIPCGHYPYNYWTKIFGEEIL